MEFNFKIDNKLISRELLIEGFTKKVECKNYIINSYGRKLDRAPTQYKFDREKKFEIWKEVRHISYPYPAPGYIETRVDLLISIEGEPLASDIGVITDYRLLKTKLKLDCCIFRG